MYAKHNLTPNESQEITNHYTHNTHTHTHKENGAQGLNQLNELVGQFWTGSFTWIVQMNQFAQMNQTFQR